MMWPDIEVQLVRADLRNQTRVLDWAFLVQPSEATEPQRALKMALDLRPDLVYFLTDGNIPEGTVRVVKNCCRSSTKIHSICVGDDANVDVMQQIAELTNGNFRTTN